MFSIVCCMYCIILCLLYRTVSMVSLCCVYLTMLSMEERSGDNLCLGSSWEELLEMVILCDALDSMVGHVVCSCA